jgi:membrane associated rhomboid family serine protease
LARWSAEGRRARTRLAPVVTPRSVLAAAVFVGVAGFTIGGVIAAVNGNGDAASNAAVAALLGTIVGALVAKE